MTYPEIEEFTKAVVLKYLSEIVQAEANNKPYPESLTHIAIGLSHTYNMTCSSIYVTILRDVYNIRISI